MGLKFGTNDLAAAYRGSASVENFCMGGVSLGGAKPTPPVTNGVIRLADGTSNLLQTDGTSKVIKAQAND